jgi:hypothetical protein
VQSLVGLASKINGQWAGSVWGMKTGASTNLPEDFRSLKREMRSELYLIEEFCAHITAADSLDSGGQGLECRRCRMTFPTRL